MHPSHYYTKQGEGLGMAGLTKPLTYIYYVDSLSVAGLPYKRPTMTDEAYRIYEKMVAQSESQPSIADVLGTTKGTLVNALVSYKAGIK